MRENYQDLYNLMIILGKHKKNPKEAENTLQRTVENMRDKGWIEASSGEVIIGLRIKGIKNY